MVSQNVRVKNPSGLHLRPAGVLCSTALQFKCRVRFTFREATVNAKSVLSVLGACVKEGDEKVFRYCPAINRHERPVLPVTHRVNQASDILFTRTTLPVNQDRHRGRSYQMNIFILPIGTFTHSFLYKKSSSFSLLQEQTWQRALPPTSKLPATF